MWTSLSGVTLAVLGTAMITPWTAAFYVLWVIVSRYILALTFLTVRPSINLVYIPLLYFNQIFGSAVKVMIFFRLDRQRWTRQKTSFKKTDSRFDAAFKLWSSRLMNAVAVLVFVASLVFLANIGSDFSGESPERLPKITDKVF
jgi:glycosyltransferase Alg8